jgi:hypothetical protein
MLDDDVAREQSRVRLSCGSGRPASLSQLQAAGRLLVASGLCGLPSLCTWQRRLRMHSTPRSTTPPSRCFSALTHLRRHDNLGRHGGPGSFTLGPGEGRFIDLGDFGMTVKATDSETAGVVAVLEAEEPPGFGPPIHVHHDCAEGFYVLEGEYINGRILRRSCGGTSERGCHRR